MSYRQSSSLEGKKTKFNVRTYVRICLRSIFGLSSSLNDGITKGIFPAGFQQKRVRSEASAAVWFEVFALLGCYAALVDIYRCFGPTYRSQFQGSSSTTRTQ